MQGGDRALCSLVSHARPACGFTKPPTPRMQRVRLSLFVNDPQARHHPQFSGFVVVKIGSTEVHLPIIAV